MSPAPKVPGVFARYDLRLEQEREAVERIPEGMLLQTLVETLVAGREEETEKLVEKLLETMEPMRLINQGLLPAMKEVSRLWEAGVYFLPQVILSSDAMIAAIALCERKMRRHLERKARIVTHTAEGDIHDIGQSIVNALLTASGFEVINLGADVPVEEVVAACQTYKPVLLTGTALMTTTMTAFPRIAARLRQQGLELPFACGGGAVSQEFVTGFDLGIWGRDASQAPGMAEDAAQGMDWRQMRAKWNR